MRLGRHGPARRRLDRAYDYYAATVGRTPPLYYQLNGRLTIAEVESTCGGGGAGCGWLGATGIEMQSTYFEEMYRYVADENL